MPQEASTKPANVYYGVGSEDSTGTCLLSRPDFDCLRCTSKRGVFLRLRAHCMVGVPDNLFKAIFSHRN